MLCVNRSTSKASKILGEIMGKLSKSIDTSMGELNKNPVLSLGLSRGFTKADVKKAYRMGALKYHPGDQTLRSFGKFVFHRFIPFVPFFL